MQIHGTNHIHGPQGISGPYTSRSNNQRPVGTAGSTGDQLDISPAAQEAAQAVESGEIRLELVNRVRNEIAAGTYETSDKLDSALEQLLDDIA